MLRNRFCPLLQHLDAPRQAEALQRLSKHGRAPNPRLDEDAPRFGPRSREHESRDAASRPEIDKRRGRVTECRLRRFDEAARMVDVDLDRSRTQKSQVAG